MNTLIPPDEIYVPFQTAVDLDVLARDGVITNERKFLLATAEREAARQMHEVLKYVEGLFLHTHNPRKESNALFRIQEVLNLAEEKSDG